LEQRMGKSDGKKISQITKNVPTQDKGEETSEKDTGEEIAPTVHVGEQDAETGKGKGEEKIFGKPELRLSSRNPAG